MKQFSHFDMLIAVMVWFVIGCALGVAASAGERDAFITPKGKTTTPPGAVNLCSKYAWACSTKGVGRQDIDMQVARAVNNSVNRRINQIDDIVQYGKEDHWTLPTAIGGDCEDLALLKKYWLMQKGVAPENLLIATVLDLNRNSHAVLILRTKRGDYVLDSLRDGIKLWGATGYTFLKMQNPQSMHQWSAILAGGLIK